MTSVDIADHELAARAAGLELVWKRGTCKGGPFCAPFVASTGAPWRPLVDDGDSRRLEVAAQLSLYQFRDGCAAATNALFFSEPYDGDPLAAARRAVFRAAVHIGLSLTAPGGSRQPLFL